MKSYEIERKFLVTEEFEKLDKEYVPWAIIHQGYIYNDDKGVVRIREQINKNRIPEANDKYETQYILCVKGSTEGIKRQEEEMPISKEMGEILLSLCDIVLTKKRYFWKENGMTWEIDLFLNKELRDLKIAEIEINNEDEQFVKPSFIGKEVSYDPNYYNSKIIKRLENKE